MEMKKQVGILLTEVRKQVPLVHNITNYVTVNDCANVVLAIGASPIMADDRREVEDITSIASALVINIGTLNERTVESMLLAGKKANEKQIPVIFDPVGAGASAFRNETTKKIIEEVKISILRGNLSEVSYIAGLEVATKGVDSAESDNRNDSVDVAKKAAKQIGGVVAITGVTDVISNGEKVIKIHNGTKRLSKVTGTGCMTSALAGSYAGAGKDYLTAAVAGVASMAIAGEIAEEKTKDTGLGSFHMAVIDALSNLDADEIEKRAKFDEE